MNKIENNSNNNLEATRTHFRFFLSFIIIVISTTGIAAIAYFALKYSDDLSGETVFTAIIGLAGTWVGTILAFYYSKENFESAERSTRALVNQVSSSKQKLESIKAESAMLLIDEANRAELK